ncbi:hypothetical protein AB0C01_10980 [Micromonospora sp. NPDC048905]|uniref:hypothetical protein n=1 Tax=Micromonospora sp. NPDC048905 TaxID=3155494 RepID=UPI0033E7F68D
MGAPGPMDTVAVVAISADRALGADPARHPVDAPAARGAVDARRTDVPLVAGSGRRLRRAAGRITAAGVAHAGRIAASGVAPAAGPAAVRGLAAAGLSAAVRLPRLSTGRR